MGLGYLRTGPGAASSGRSGTTPDPQRQGRAGPAMSGCTSWTQRAGCAGCRMGRCSRGDHGAGHTGLWRQISPDHRGVNAAFPCVNGQTLVGLARSLSVRLRPPRGISIGQAVSQSDRVRRSTTNAGTWASMPRSAGVTSGRTAHSSGDSSSATGSVTTTWPGAPTLTKRERRFTSGPK